MQNPSTPIQLIVGLGNPGPEYQSTRHNAGEDFVRQLAADRGQSLVNTPKFFGYSGKILALGQEVKLLVPTTFMNRSGQSVAALANFYKISPEAILVAHDELDLPPGTARLKVGGGHGGHNGLRDIISALGNNKNFRRLRLGIGHPGNAKLVSNFVLKKAPREEFDQIDEAMRSASKVMELCITGDWEKAMHQLHSQ